MSVDKTRLESFPRGATSVLVAVALTAMFVVGGQGTAFSQSGDFDLAGSVADGKGVFAQYCASCHGPKGEGDGPAASALNPKPADFTDAARMSDVSDKELYLATRDGGLAIGKSPIMPGWKGTLTDTQIRDVAAYIRSLSE